MRGDTARLAGSFAPVHPQGGDETANGVALAVDAPRRSGSETRKRSTILPVRLTPVERAAIEEKAARAGLTTASFARRVLLGADAPRQVRRPPIERKELARLLGELGHIGANLNQLAHAGNSGLPVPRQDLVKALASLASVRDAILSALGRRE